MPSFTIFCCHFSVLPMSCSRRQPVTMELHSGRLWVPSRNSGLHGKVEPRSTRRGNSRVRALTDVSWKAAGYIGPVPTLLLPLCPALPLPNFSFSLKRKKKMSLPERSLKEPERIYLVKKNGITSLGRLQAPVCLPVKERRFLYWGPHANVFKPPPFDLL